MSLPHDIPISALHYYLTAPYPCSYLPDLRARSQVATPEFLIDKAMYSQLVRHGFRRSGTHTYRPRCDHCRACVPLRIPIRAFRPNRAQRRAWTRHAGIEVSVHTLEFRDEHYALYQRYQQQRHADGEMADDSRDTYRNFLLRSHVETALVEFREHGILRMVSFIDILDDGLSSVYTFFDPDPPQASYGIFNVLWQIELSRQLGLDYVYPGYWIRDCRKMAYKIRFQPAEGLIHGQWQPLPDLKGNL
ncbi:MAG: arginyltransferase [Gallionella sp.]|jgi:arginine-tRNA-protein transferase|nr:arginyltransferase [Gallionella sp.]